jgi:hypothetical protein
MFFVRTANPAAGVVTPVDVNVPVLVLAQSLGVTLQAGIVKVVVSPI